MTLGFTKQVSEYRTFQDSLSPADQLAFSEIPVGRQFQIIKAASGLELAPGAVEFYLSESARAASPLNLVPVNDGLFVSSLAVETARPAFLLEYVGQYGVTDALRLASPKVINGMTGYNILNQTQEMLSSDTGYNVSPESWFGKHPEIGRSGTFITNEAAIERIIGDVDGSTTIKVTEAEAVELAKALGLTSTSLVDGFRISKISEISSMDLAFPTKSLSPLFLGPGKGLPGGGPELIISPSVPMDSPYIVEQIIIEVVP
jgi:hypothetical protein